MLLAQFLKQLLAIAAIVEVVVSEDDVERVRSHLAQYPRSPRRRYARH